MSHAESHQFDEREGLQVDSSGLEIVKAEKIVSYVHEQGYHGSDGQKQADETINRTRRICGLRRTTFFLTVAIVSIIILAGAIGGGVGGTMAANNSRVVNNPSAASTITITASQPTTNPTTSPTPSSPQTTSTSLPPSTPTSSSPIRVPTTGFLFLDCPSIDSTTVSVTPVRSPKSYSFHLSCGSEFVSASGSGQEIDILPIVAYSLTDCLRACASYNDNQGRNGCVAVVFNSNLDQVGWNGGTCWLKNSTTKQNLGLGDTAVGARLV